MVRMKPRIDRDKVLREEARRRAVEHCIHCIPDLLHPDEGVGMPVRQGSRIVIPIVKKTAEAAALLRARMLA